MRASPVGLVSTRAGPWPMPGLTPIPAMVSGLPVLSKSVSAGSALTVWNSGSVSQRIRYAAEVERQFNFQIPLSFGDAPQILLCSAGGSSQNPGLRSRQRQVKNVPGGIKYVRIRQLTPQNPRRTSRGIDGAQETGLAGLAQLHKAPGQHQNAPCLQTLGKGKRRLQGPFRFRPRTFTRALETARRPIFRSLPHLIDQVLEQDGSSRHEGSEICPSAVPWNPCRLMKSSRLERPCATSQRSSSALVSSIPRVPVTIFVSRPGWPAAAASCASRA